jgi:hypothetical protein
MAQALMKRSIADIPIVTHIQKESAGMNKLYSQSMCSVKQWKSYQAAEAMVSSEVDDVRAEADEIEPGWSQVSYIFEYIIGGGMRIMCSHCAIHVLVRQVIWRQAMQYHNMLKQKHEMEQKAATEAAAKKKAIEEKVRNYKSPEDIAKEKAEAAEQAAKELIMQEEREIGSKKSFTGVKKGFLDKKK